MKLPSSVGQKKVKAIEQILTELGIDLSPMPTEEVVLLYNELRSRPGAPLRAEAGARHLRVRAAHAPRTATTTCAPSRGAPSRRRRRRRRRRGAEGLARASAAAAPSSSSSASTGATTTAALPTRRRRRPPRPPPPPPPRRPCPVPTAGVRPDGELQSADVARSDGLADAMGANISRKRRESAPGVCLMKKKKN
ncbi:unnamed protein product [Lampetra planeri]